MTWPARVFGTDGEEIADLEAWLAHAPPEKGAIQWQDGYSAKEQAKAWLRSATPAVPEELREALLGLQLGEIDELFARPEHMTRLDEYGRGRQHDLFACARYEGATRFVVGVEAKACEDFDGIVADRAREPPSNKRARCNLLSGALFGRPVFDEATGALLDGGLARHGYQLWTAAVGTIVEAQQRGIDDAVVVVHQFVPRDLDEVREGDRRDWAAALASNAEQFDAFVSALTETGATSRQTGVVGAGTRLHALKVLSVEPVTIGRVGGEDLSTRPPGEAHAPVGRGRAGG
jgi:hypothetical protein